MHRTFLSTLALAGGLLAQSVVVPNANETTLGTGQLNSIIRNAGNPRTYQIGINAAEIANVPLASVITGVSLRFSQLASNPVAWPPADITWTDYEIWAGQANPTSSWVSDPALNFAGTPHQVRSGPMTLDANVFANLSVPGVPNPWAEFYFEFQDPYLYLGGDLALLFTHPGSNDTALAQYPETVASSASSYGVGRYGSTYQGTTTNASTFYVMRIHYGYGTGCPASSGDVPVLVQNGNVTGGTGGNILLQTANVGAGEAVVYALGFTQLQAPLGGGCDLLVTPDVLLFGGLADANGRVVLDIPVAPGAIGNFHAQAAVLDFTLPLGFATSNGVSPSAN